MASPVNDVTSTVTHSPTQPKLAVLIGAGQRGIVYSNYALDRPDLLRIVGVADPIEERRVAIQQKFQLHTEKQVYADWRTLLEKMKLPKGSIAIIATPDRGHHEPAVEFAEAGYHILLEKPMAVELSDCRAISSAALKNDTIFAVCHVLRYTPVNRLIHKLIGDGTIGELINIQHLEPVGHSHFAHSYVRGNWHSEKDSTFSLMAKSCHDIDLLQYWAEAGSSGPGSNPVTKVQSFGSLLHFRPDKKPVGANTGRCMTCPVEQSCVYSAKKIYLSGLQDPTYTGWKPNYLALIDNAVPDIENVTKALESGPYGKCVYDAGNDVCDNQVVNLSFLQGQTSSFSMVSASEKICRRQTTVFGSKGELRCDGYKVTHHSFETGITIVYDPMVPEDGTEPINVGRLTGHEGADFFLMSTFIEAVRTGDRSKITSGAVNSLTSHKIVFAAEASRKQGGMMYHSVPLRSHKRDPIIPSIQKAGNNGAVAPAPITTSTDPFLVRRIIQWVKWRQVVPLPSVPEPNGNPFASPTTSSCISPSLLSELSSRFHLPTNQLSSIILSHSSSFAAPTENSLSIASPLHFQLQRTPHTTDRSMEEEWTMAVISAFHSDTKECYARVMELFGESLESAVLAQVLPDSPLEWR